MTEIIGKNFVITEFCNIPFGAHFRCYKQWLQKTNYDRFKGVNSAGVMDESKLVIVKISDMSPEKRKDLEAKSKAKNLLGK